MAVGVGRINCNQWATTQGGGWWNGGDAAYHNDRVVYQFDLRALAARVLANHPYAYLEYVWGDRRIKEGKNGGSVPIYVPNIPSNIGWIGNPNQLNGSMVWNAGARGTTEQTNVDGHSWRTAWFGAGLQNAPIPFTDLLTTPLWMATDHRWTTGKHRIYWTSMGITSMNIFELRPGFPGWAEEVMRNNQKAVPGWMDQLVTNNWATAFVGGKQYLSSI